MLQLSIDQAQRLQAIKLERDTASLAQNLAAGFPDVPGRLGERYELLVRHGVQCGARHGLLHTVCVARYLACWFMLGAEFESKPGFEWAAAILASPRSDQGAKVFQLCRRVREELARPAMPGAPAAPSPAAFDAAIAQLDGSLMPRGELGSLLPPLQVQLGAACDIDALDLRLPDAAPAQRYVPDQGQWRRQAVAGSAAPITLSAGHAAQPAALPLGATAAPPPTLAPRLSLLAPAGGREPARLRLRTRSAACCDPAVHPLVTLNGSQGLTQWRGPHAADILLTLPPALPAAVDSDGLQPRIAVESSAQISLLTLSTCGLRDSGTPLGELGTQLAVYASEQHLVAWRREAGGAVVLPDEPAPATPASSRIRVERDGLPLDSLRWQAALEDLDRQLQEGLGRMVTAWERETGVSQARLQSEPRVMCGSAGITWGWAEGAQGLASAPLFRVAGALDLVACQLGLRLSGTLKLRGSLSRISLHCAGAHPLQARFDGAASGPELLELLTRSAAQFSLPLVLQLEALAQDDLAMLDIAGAVVGSLQGSCGLRQRPDGPGLQWFAKLTTDPVSVRLLLHDPLLGTREHQQRLLPALTLLDWSL